MPHTYMRTLLESIGVKISTSRVSELNMRSVMNGVWWEPPRKDWHTVFEEKTEGVRESIKHRLKSQQHR